MASDEFIGQIADMAASGQHIGNFSAMALAMILERLHEERPFRPEQVEKLKLSAIALHAHAGSTQEPTAVAADARVQAVLQTLG